MGYLIKNISKPYINSIYEFTHTYTHKHTQTHTHTHTYIYIYIYKTSVLKFKRDSIYNSYKIFHYRILELNDKEKAA
jgi:hypothetical protein